MGRIGGDLNIDFVVSSRDNFYDNGLRRTNDPFFEDLFSKIYTTNSLQKQWYSDIVELFFVYTTPFVDKYFLKPKKHHYNWRGVIPRNNYLTKLLKANNVDFYINGHDHCLQHISSSTSPIQFLTSGGGSKAWRRVIDYDKLTKNETKFYYDGQDFMPVVVKQDQADIKFYNVFGQVLHTLNLSNHLRAAAYDSFAFATY